MLHRRMHVSFWAYIAVNILQLLLSLKNVAGFVNSPKIITKDGNLVFESGMNRNITFRLNGKSRLTINDQYDLLDLILLRKRLRNSTFPDGLDGDTEWPGGDPTSLSRILNEVTELKGRVYGPRGVITRMREFQNRTTASGQNMQRLQARMRRFETTLTTITNRLENDNCKSNPCANGGQCYSLYNGFMCKCTSNFEGKTCEKDVNECALFEHTDLGCQNGAQCLNTFGGYSCLCTPGWFGIHCTQRKGDCLQMSAWEICGHGTCVPAAGNDNFGYRCICNQGWKTNGLTPACMVDVNECTETKSPCITECINLPGSFTCAPCSSGLEGNGVNCRDIDECAINNGGCSLSPHVHCINTYGSYHCGECPLGWTGNGRTCIRAGSNENGVSSASCSENNICYPGATCTEISNTVVCTCPAGTVGNGIGVNGCVAGTAKNCGSFPCLNGGTCVDSGDTFLCICPPGFKLPNCTPLPSPCTPNPCHNNGFCRPTDDTSFQCQCAPGYSGRLCDGHISRCGGVLYGLSGRLKYPEASLYDHNSQCAWLIRTNDTKVLNVTFTAFDLEDSTECRFDWLQINDGRTAAAQVIGRFCGVNKPMGGNIISSTSYLYLWFRSDNSTAREGFELEWNSIAPQCGGPIDVESHGSIATPGSPGNYPKNRDCMWLLTAPNNKRIKLTFFSMEIEKHESCEFDYVQITDAISGLVLEKFCNSSRPAPLLLPTNQATIHFHSDNEGADTGFQIYYSLEERVPGCGGTFTAKEGTIKSPIIVGESISCEYDIKMSTSESITIEFTKFEMGADDCVEFYDVNRESQIKELQSKYCGGYRFTPTVFHSLYNAVQIKYFSKGGEFILHYKADCSYTYESANDVILSPGYPNLTKVDHFCTYKIITEPGTVVSLHVEDFELRDTSLDDNDCAYSYLRINDGPDQNLLGPFCNEDQPPTNYISKSNMVILQYQSGSTSLGKGFKIEYRSVAMQKSDCGGVYTKPGYTIRLPTNEEGQYNDDAECYWVIMAPHGKGIVINWKSFKLETTFDCNYDYVEIYDSLAGNAKPLGRFCDVRIPPSILSFSRILTIKFVSDYSDSAEGFEATYSFVNTSDHCGGDIFSSTGKLYSPGWPGNYTSELDCVWTITAPPLTQLELQVSMFELEAERDHHCESDWLEIRNGGSESSPLIGKFCGRNIPQAIPSFTNQLRLHLHTDNYISARGFEINWAVFSNGCGGILKGETGVITSPFYPQPYPNDATCEWRILVHKGSVIHITIEDIDIEELFQCNYDFIEIFDGQSTAEKPIAKLCKAEEYQQNFVTKRNGALVRFQTDSSNSQRGFLLSYKSNCTLTITDIHGSIESPNFGETYYDNALSCAWTLAAPKGNHIKVEITYFDTTQRGRIYFKENSIVGAKDSKVLTITEAREFESAGESITIIQNSTDVTFSLDFAMVGCIESLHRETGEFKSPNHPSMYPNDLECMWDIEVPFGKGIELTIAELDIEDSVNCTKDALQISNEVNSKHPHERHCGKRDNDLVITSSSHRLYVRFYSDSSHNGKGFKASYKTINSTCGGTVHGRKGVITSPNYPLNYPPSVFCEWKIEVSEHHTIKMVFDELDIEDFYDCDMDSVAGYDTALEGGETDEERLFNICGTLEDTPETSFTTSSNVAKITFKSDESNELKGFKVHFEEQCGERIMIDDDFFGGIDITRHDQTNETCVWKLIAKDTAKRVTLIVTHVELTPLTAMSYVSDRDCIARGVKVYDGLDVGGPLRSSFCRKHPPSITSHGHALTIAVPLNVVGEFEAHFYIMTDYCGGLFKSISGSFSTPHYPSSYPVNLVCQYYLVASMGNSMVLTFEDLDLELSDECNNDYVEVREESDTGPLLGVYCGSTVPPPIEGKKLIWIKFNSDDDNVGKGFLAAYNYAKHNELNGTNGEIESPSYPSKFHSDEIYSWRISVDKDYVVLLSIEHVVDVDIPYIKFYDGYSDIGAEIDYSTSHKVISNTNILYFTAQRGPFKFKWDSLGKSAIRANRTAEQHLTTCGNPIVWVSDTITFDSPGFPDGYEANMDCSWTLVPQNAAMHATLRFRKIDLEEFPDCFADYVSVSSSSDMKSWKELDKLCKKDITTIKLYQGTPFLKLDFHTDSTNNQTGFSSYVKTECGSLLTDRKGFVNITEFAKGVNFYQMNCVWTINVRQGRRIRISFEESYLRNVNDTSSCATYFLIRNGIDEDSPFLGKGKFCENDISDDLVTTSNHAYIKFQRNGFPKFKAAFRYEEIMHECSDEIVLSEDPLYDTRTISSPNFPNIANPHTECIWKISAPVHHIIAIHFLEKFELTAGSGPLADSCVREYVQLNDGATDLMPMIGRYCGTTRPDTKYTTGNLLRVKYLTDVPEPKAGFKANVSIARCGGFFYGSNGVVQSPSNIVLQGEHIEFECVYTFEAPEDHVVQVEVDMNFPEEGNCSMTSHLEIQEVDSYGEIENVTDKLIICGVLQKTYLVETNKLVVRYRIKENSHRTDSFKITYKMLGSRCGETIVASAGVLQTPGYPNGVTRPTHCVWRLQVPKGRRIKIDFIDFDTGGRLLANTSSDQMHAFRGRITFANDFNMQSIITRVTDDPPANVYSTDSTMTIDAFLLSLNRHRGFKLRFSSNEDSEICKPSFGLREDSVIQFRSNSSTENYCSYSLSVRPNHTTVLTIDNYQQYEATFLGGFVCEIFAPLKLQSFERKLLPNLFCENSTFPLTLRLPYPVKMHITGNKRNKLSSLDVRRTSHDCGGILPTYPVFIGDNTTITMPIMDSSFSGPLDCAWAVWPSEDNVVEDWNTFEFWRDVFQLEVAITTNFKGKCEDEYILLYNGPNQDSPHLGRFCSVSSASNLIAERGLFVEYHSSNYQRQSFLNVTARPGSGCGGRLSYPYRDIAFYDEYYKNNVECIWEVTTDPGFHIGMVFKDRFFIESSPNCKKDYLKIQQRYSSSDNWTDIQTICGRDPPKTVNTTTTQLRLIFRSDNDTLGEGFSIKFERNCGGILIASPDIKELSSPGYPNVMPNNLYCNYTIISQDEGKKGMLLRFKELDFEAPPINKCLFDNVTIIDDNESSDSKRTVLCGNKKNHEIRVAKRVSLIVQTDSTFPSRGFLMEYSNNVCGGVVLNSTIIESPHQQSDGTFPPNSNCFWNITAPEGHKILIKFEQLEFESQSECVFDSVEIYKGEGAVLDQRMAKFCGNMTGQLPTISVQDNKAVIRSHSDERDVSKGFKAIISFVRNCDKDIQLSSEYEMTTFAGSYDNNLDCSYVFKTDPGRQLQIDFNSFHLEETPACTADYLQLRDGAGPFADEIGRFCGHILPTRLVSSQNSLFLRFVSDNNITSSGFSARISSVPLLCGSHNINLENDKKYTLSSPEYGSGHSPKNIACLWKIKCNSNVHLKFEEIDIGDSTQDEACTGNYLQIYNREDAEMIEKGYGTHLVLNNHLKGEDYMNFATEYVYCGKNVPDDFFSYSKEIYVKYKTNGNITGKGFSLTAMPAIGCYRNFTGTQGRIIIADTNDHCDIHLKAPENYTLSLYFASISFSEYNCETEYLEVFDGHTNTSLKKLCGYVDVGKSLFTMSNELRMRIKMNTRYTEFDITYLANRYGPGCGGDLYNTAGLIASPFYPNNVRNSSDCMWNIRVPSNLHVLLRFTDFNMGAKATCISDYLQILEYGISGESHVVRQFCGEDDPKIYKSTHNYLSIRFRKTVNFDGTGWVIRFNGVHSNYKIPSYYFANSYYN